MSRPPTDFILSNYLPELFLSVDAIVFTAVSITGEVVHMAVAAPCGDIEVEARLLALPEGAHHLILQWLQHIGEYSPAFGLNERFDRHSWNDLQLMIAWQSLCSGTAMRTV